MNDLTSSATVEPHPSHRRGAPPPVLPPVDPASILASLGFLAYTWDIASGALSFAGDPLEILPGEWGHRFENVARLEESQASPARGLRQAALFGEERLDDGSGIPYALSYRLRSRDGSLFLLEESGRWFAGLPGRPTLARGLLKVRALLRETAEGACAQEATAEVAGDDALREALQRATQQAQRSRRGFALLAVAADGGPPGDASTARLRGVMRRGDSLLRIDTDMSLCVLNACDEAQLATAVKRLEAAFAAAEAGPDGVPARNVILGATWKGTHANAEALATSVLARARSQLRGPAGSAASPAPGRRRAVDWQAEIINALNERRLTLAYQPVVHARSRRLAFHEALLRLRNRAGRILPASVFISASEENGLVSLLDRRVIALAAEELRRRPQLKLAINASAISLRDPEWLGTLRSNAGNGNVLAGRLIVEITESAVLDIKRTRETLRAVKELDIGIAIDDFGAGHTSFRVLRELPIDIIKIDGTFIQDADRSSDARFFIRTLIDLARHLGCKVVGEWVESEASAGIVEKLGVNYLQGRHLGMPKLLAQPRRLPERLKVA